MNKLYNAITAICVAFCLLQVNPIHAQTIINDLQSQTNASDGKIHIECDPSILALIGKPNSQLVASGNHSDFLEQKGFRIQVFMGNDSKARAEATSKQSSIQSAFPELSTYVRYEAPNFRLLVGDFITREEANMVKQLLQKEFPQFGKEMYIVSDKIRLFIER